MSELKVDKVSPRSGTTVTLGDSGDSVGIGTASPSSKLTVDAGNVNGGGAKITSSNQNTYFIIDNTGTGGAEWTLASSSSGSGFGTGSLAFASEGTERMRIDNSGHVTKPSQPAVHAYSSSAQDNIATGIVTIQLDAEIYDVNSDFDTATYTFTAPVTGKYLVTMNLVLGNTDTAFQWIYLLGVSSNRNYYLNQIDPRMLVQDGNWSWVGSSLVDMDANDTFIMKTRSSAHGAAQMDVVSGTATSPETQMTITLLS